MPINTIYDKTRGLFQRRTRQSGSFIINSSMFVQGEELTGESILSSSNSTNTIDEVSGTLDLVSSSYVLTSASYDELSAYYELLSSSYVLTSGSHDQLSSSFVITSGTLDTLLVDYTPIASHNLLSSSFVITSGSHDELSSSFVITSGSHDQLSSSFVITSGSYDELSSSYELLSASYVLTSGTVDSLGGGGSSVAGIVEIFEKDDFPTPIGGVINLTSSFLYQIKDNIDLGTDVLEGVDITLTGLGAQNASIITAAPGALLENDVNGYIVINDLVLSNSVGSILDVGLDTHSASYVSINRSIFDSGKAGNIGTISGSHNLVIRDTEFVDYIDGLVLSGPFEQVKIDSSLFTSAEAVTSSSAYGIKFDDNFFSNSTILNATSFSTTNPGDIALDISTVISTSANIEDPIGIHNCIFRGSGTNFSDLDETNAFVQVSNASGQAASKSYAYMQQDGIKEGIDYTTRQIIGLASTLDAGSGFSKIGNATLRYDGIMTKNFSCTVFATTERGGSSTELYTLQITLNGITKIQIQRISVTSSKGQFSFSGIIESVTQNDEIDIYIDEVNGEIDFTSLGLAVMEI